MTSAMSCGADTLVCALRFERSEKQQAGVPIRLLRSRLVAQDSSVPHRCWNMPAPSNSEQKAQSTQLATHFTVEISTWAFFFLLISTSGSRTTCWGPSLFCSVQSNVVFCTPYCLQAVFERISRAWSLCAYRSSTVALGTNATVMGKGVFT